MRKKVILLIISFTSLIIIGLFYFTKSNVANVPHLEFALQGESSPEKNFPYELKIDTTFTGKGDIYKLKSKNINNIKFKELANKFSLFPSDNEIIYDQFSGFMYNKDNKYISVEESGRLIYSIENPVDLNKKGKIKLLSDSEVKKIAKEFLADRGLLPSDFYIDSVGEGLVCEYADGTKDIVNKQVTFHRKINGKEVLGVSRIQIDVGENGQVERVAIIYNDYEPYTKKDLKPIKQAIEELKNDKGLENFEKGLHPQKCIIDKVELVYFEQPDVNSPQSFIYPVYKFTGKTIDNQQNEADYTGIIEATE